MRMGGESGFKVDLEARTDERVTVGCRGDEAGGENEVRKARKGMSSFGRKISSSLDLCHVSVAGREKAQGDAGVWNSGDRLGGDTCLRIVRCHTFEGLF